MKRKLILIMLVIFLIANFATIKITKAQIPTIYVEPPLKIIQEIGVIFEINISISQVADLTAWEFKLYYESAILNATSWGEGPFLISSRNTTVWVFNFTDSFNATHGRIWIACMLVGPGPGTSGNGTLATIAFKTVGTGTANLHLEDTDLLDSMMPPNHITHITADGNVQVIGHDIAIISVTPLRTFLGQGFSTDVNVIIENQGAYTETFNVIVYANATSIQNKTITLDSGSLTTITFTWNTSGYPKENYTISAYAWPVQGETETEDNIKIDNLVTVTRVGDLGGTRNGCPTFFACDGKVDAYDLALFIQCYKGSAPPEAMYLGDLGSGPPPRFYQCDNKVDAFDLALFIYCYKGLVDP